MRRFGVSRLVRELGFSLSKCAPAALWYRTGTPYLQRAAAVRRYLIEIAGEP